MKYLFDEEKLYNVAQRYRHMPLTEFEEIAKAYTDIQNFIQSEIARNVRESLNRMKSMSISKLQFFTEKSQFQAGYDAAHKRNVNYIIEELSRLEDKP